jgi:hypothetical protein
MCSLAPFGPIQAVRQEFTDLSSTYQERRMNYDKVGVGLELERQTLEKDCNFFQVPYTVPCSQRIV